MAVSAGDDVVATVDPASRELVAAIFGAVEGVTARFPRSLFLSRARDHGGIEELWEAMVDADLLAIGLPENLGGAGGGLTGCTAIMEALARRGVPPLQYSLTAFSREAILRHGSPEQIARHVTPTLTGRRRICLGVTEPDAGTNAFAARTTAVRLPSGAWRLNGQKIYISAADESDHMLLLARTAPPGEEVGRRKGFGLFMVDLSLPGIDRRRLDIEWYAPEHQCEVYLDDVEVDGGSLIGEEGQGFDHLLACLNQERITIAAWALGLGHLALTRAVEHAKVRAPFGRPIGSHQAVAHPLAQARAEMDAARLMMYAAAAEYDRTGEAGASAGTAKLLASQSALHAVEAAIQTHGGSAFVYDTDVVTLWPMIRVLQIAPLNNEVILSQLAERVLGLPRS